MLTTFTTRPVATAVTVILLVAIARFFQRAYVQRRRFHNLPGPPHSWIFGHLKVMGEAMNDVPQRAHPQVLPLRLQQKYNLPNYYYMDLWPVADPMFICWDPAIATNITNDIVLRKHPVLEIFMRILAGPGDLVSSNGAHWKKWRSVFNPGFAASHLMTLVPAIVDHSVVFANKLSQYAATGKVFRLEEDATRLTVDIIGRVALDTQLDTQTGENEMVTAFRKQVHLCPNEGPREPFKVWYPSGIYQRWRNSRTMDDYIGKVLDERFAVQSNTSNGTTAKSRPQKGRRRAIVDLALESYRSQTGNVNSAGIDEEFKKAATVQIRTFIFAGHDTTSSTICYALYELQRHPACLARIREEHDRILGDMQDTADVLKSDPHILNRLEYTTAVIRETLRLWPPASGTREAKAGSVTTDPKTGEVLPLDGLLLWIIPYAMQRSRDVWGPTANDFDPARFLEGSATQVPENGWRAFEKGARNCIGQNLAMVETKIILALVVRSFDIELAYDALNELKADGSFWAKDERWRAGRQDCDGEQAYQVLIGTAKPREGMPVRVKKLLS